MSFAGGRTRCHGCRRVGEGRGQVGCLIGYWMHTQEREEGEDSELPANPFWSLWPHECLDQMKDGYHRQGSPSALLTCHKTWRRSEILVITLNDHCNAEPKIFADPQTIRLVLSAMAECFSQYSFIRKLLFHFRINRWKPRPDNDEGCADWITGSHAQRFNWIGERYRWIRYAT
jgi:hypothetical protein